MKKITKKFIFSLMVCAIFFFASTSILSAADCDAVYGSGKHEFRLATGSPGELGLLNMLVDNFNKENNTRLCWVKAGSGKSLKLLKAKEVDMVMVHAPDAEKKAVEDGWAEKRTLIGSNEFYIVGPKDDPAKIANAKTAKDAYLKIAKLKKNFLSRGDNSGTHKKEMEIWKSANIKSSGKWYIITNDFMMATLKRADIESGYFMVDSSTWAAAKEDITNLKVLFKGDPILINVYHALCLPDGETDGQAYASKFIDFVSSDAGQKIIREYGKDLYGEPMYNDANYAIQYDH